MSLWLVLRKPFKNKLMLLLVIWQGAKFKIDLRWYVLRLCLWLILCVCQWNSIQEKNFIKALRKNLPKHVCSTVQFLLKALLSFCSRENVCFDRLKWATHTWIQYLDRDQLLAFHWWRSGGFHGGVWRRQHGIVGIVRGRGRHSWDLLVL